MNKERIGIVLTAGYINREKQLWAAAEMGNKPPEHTAEPPDATGMMRLAAASFALRKHYLDRVIVVGGMPDDLGVPVEEGHQEKLLWYAGEDNSGRIGVLPRRGPTAETVSDLREAINAIKDRGIGGENPGLVVISDRVHLYPRTVLAMRLLGYPEAEFLSTEKLLGELSDEVRDKYGIKVPVRAGYGGLRTFLTRELPISAILASDLLPGRNGRGVKFLEDKAKKERIKQ